MWNQGIFCYIYVIVMLCKHTFLMLLPFCFISTSSVDKAHLKLASAKAIIRLSKHWDKKIPVDLFHLTLRTSEVNKNTLDCYVCFCLLPELLIDCLFLWCMQARFPQVRKLFLKKVHQYIKNRSLDPKYVCAFLLDFRSQKPIREEVFKI